MKMPRYKYVLVERNARNRIENVLVTDSVETMRKYIEKGWQGYSSIMLLEKRRGIIREIEHRLNFWKVCLFLDDDDRFVKIDDSDRPIDFRSLLKRGVGNE